jgi:hypothetical protein
MNAETELRSLIADLEDGIGVTGMVQQPVTDSMRDALNRLTDSHNRMRTALQLSCDETDYCWVCDNHPSRAHQPGCPVGDTL